MIGSGEHEARQSAIDKTIVNVIERMHPTEGDTLTLVLDTGEAFIISADRLRLRWESNA